VIDSMWNLRAKPIVEVRLSVVFSALWLGLVGVSVLMLNFRNPLVLLIVGLIPPVWAIKGFRQSTTKAKEEPRSQLES